MQKKPKPESKNKVEKEPEQDVQSSDEGLPVEAPEDGMGSRIRAAREARGFSQVALAIRTKLFDRQGKGVSRGVLIGYESGNFKPGAREIRILSETLSVSPTWLIYGTEAVHESAQASMETIRRNDFFAAMRLALAISVLKPHERSAFQSLVLSMAGRQLGDQKLSALLTLARRLTEPALKEMEADFKEVNMEEGEVGETLNALVQKYGDGFESNYGNRLVFPEDGDGPVTGEWLYPDPTKK